MLDPVAVALKFGFLAVLYLFLLWMARSALKDLRRSANEAPEPAADATGMHTRELARSEPAGAPKLRVGSGAGLQDRRRLRPEPTGALLGRGDQADIVLEDSFASSRHARLVPHGDVIVLEDLGSTNGTYLNDEPLRGPQPLHPGRPDPHRRLRLHLRALNHAPHRRALPRLRPGPPAPGQRGQLLRPRAAVRGRRRHGRRAGRRGRVRARRAAVRGRPARREGARRARSSS